MKKLKSRMKLMITGMLWWRRWCRWQERKKIAMCKSTMTLLPRSLPYAKSCFKPKIRLLLLCQKVRCQQFVHASLTSGPSTISNPKKSRIVVSWRHYWKEVFPYLPLRVHKWHSKFHRATSISFLSFLKLCLRKKAVLDQSTLKRCLTFSLRQLEVCLYTQKKANSTKCLSRQAWFHNFAMSFQLATLNILRRSLICLAL